LLCFDLVLAPPWTRKLSVSLCVCVLLHPLINSVPEARRIEQKVKLALTVWSTVISHVEAVLAVAFRLIDCRLFAVCDNTLKYRIIEIPTVAWCFPPNISSSSAFASHRLIIRNVNYRYFLRLCATIVYIRKLQSATKRCHTEQKGKEGSWYNVQGDLLFALWRNLLW
jgi:hypothetical protein